MCPKFSSRCQSCTVPHVNAVRHWDIWFCASQQSECIGSALKALVYFVWYFSKGNAEVPPRYHCSWMSCKYFISKRKWSAFYSFCDEAYKVYKCLCRRDIVSIHALSVVIYVESFSFFGFQDFCRCLEFQLSVRLMLSIQSSVFRFSGSTEGKGNREAEIVT